MNERAYEVLQPLIRKGDRVAIIDVPSTANWGDHAIWLGERAVLHKLGAHVVHQVDSLLYDEARMRRSIGDRGLVLLHGGGSLGDLYRDRQEFRLMILSTLRDHRVIQLPQSIHFQDGSEVRRFAEAANSHPDFKLLARDLRSLAFADANFNGGATLCPDLAPNMGALNDIGTPTHDVLWIDRKGPESTHRQDVPKAHARVLVSDWALPRRRTTAVLRDVLPGALDIKLRQGQRVLPQVKPITDQIRRALLPQLPAAKLRLAQAFLCQGRVVVTDRLHGHILALLLGKPHVLLDNSIGKLSAFHAAWTAGSPLVRMADSTGEALEMAFALLPEPGR